MTLQLNEEDEEIDYKHIMSWVMFLLMWLIFRKVYAGVVFLKAIRDLITIAICGFFILDMKVYAKPFIKRMKGWISSR